MDGIITLDERQHIVLYNRAAEKIFGWSADEVLGHPLEVLLPPRFRNGHFAHVARFGATGVTSRRMGGGTIVHGLRRDGEEFPMDASISQLKTEDGHLYTVILRDITERVRAQEDLAAFAKQASAIREQEKSRVARELHDELAQSLTALKMDALWLKERMGDAPPPVLAKIDGMLAMLSDSVAATRRIAADLRPLVLDDLGLWPALEWLVQNFVQRTGITCELEGDEELELAEPYATAVFRIIQESLHNVGKHAQATAVKVSMAIEPGGLRLRVVDNGVGFDASAPRKPNSLGLAGLRERAQLLMGSVEITSVRGEGTSVQAWIPVREGGDA